MARLYHEEPDTSPFYGGRQPISALLFQQQFKEWYSGMPPESVHLAVCLRGGGALIGWVSLWSVDYLNRTAESASFMLPGFRERGFGSEAKHLLLGYAFEQLQLYVVTGTVVDVNERSQIALLRQGYQPAGRLHWTHTKGGLYGDTMLFDLTRDDWLAAHAAWRDRRSTARGMETTT
jgi:RimJ/RimL family protein N-acetyltransferase